MTPHRIRNGVLRSVLGALACTTACVDISLGSFGDAGPTAIASSTPKPVSGNGTYLQVTVGQAHACAIAADGTAWCWGQIGPYAGAHLALVPEQLPGGMHFDQLSAGASFTCGLVGGSHRVACWGNNSFGQLGDGTTTTSAIPSALARNAEFTSVTAGVTSVDVPGVHACALDVGGVAWCWGSNTFGQLGSGTFRGSQVPVAIPGMRFIALSAGPGFTCGIRDDGVAMCWGRYDSKFRQLGVQSPPSARCTDVFAREIPCAPSPIPVESPQRFASISASDSQACAITTSAEVHCWGGSLTLAPSKVAESPAARLIASGPDFACAAATGGATSCWGLNYAGQLGDGTTVGRANAAAVATSERFTSISAGRSVVCAISAGGTAYCWGEATEGKLGRPSG